MQATTTRSIGRQLPTLVVVWGLTLCFVAGCAARRPAAWTSGNTERAAGRTFDEQLRELVHELAQTDAAIEASSPSVLSSDLRRSSLTLVRHFEEALDQHAAFAESIDGEAHELDLAAEEVAAEACLEHARAVGVRAGRIAEQAALLATYRGGAATPPGSPQAVSFIDLFGRVAALAENWIPEVAGIHHAAIRPGRAAPLRVYHFHCLRATVATRLDPVAYEEAIALYRDAWTHWSNREVETASPETAADLLLVVARRTPEQFLEVCAQLRDVADACVRKPPTRRQLDLLDATFTTIHTLVGEAPENTETWRALRPEIESRLLLARAVRQELPADTIRLAGQAGRLSPQLQPDVERVLQVAASSVAEVAVAENRSADLFHMYVSALNRTNEPAQDARATNDGDWWGMTASVSEVIAEGDLVTARELLDDLAAESTTDGRRREYEALLSRYYMTLLDALASSDLDAACDVCKDATSRLSSRRELLRRCDELLNAQLRITLGEVAESYRTLGASAVRARIGNTVRKMRTDWGITQCQSQLDHVEGVWEKRATSSTDPREAFAVALELARLRGAGEARARQLAAKNLWRLFGESGKQNARSVQLACIDVFLSSCRGEPAPATLHEDFFAILEDLARDGDVDELRRRVAVFSEMFPGEAVRANALVQLAFAPASTGAIPSVRQARAGTALAAGGGAGGLREGDGACVATDGDAGWALAAGLVSAFAGALLLGATTLFTMTKGLVAFRWYALVAVASGLALGFLFGS